MYVNWKHLILAGNWVPQVQRKQQKWAHQFLASAGFHMSPNQEASSSMALGGTALLFTPEPAPATSVEALHPHKCPQPIHQGHALCVSHKPMPSHHHAVPEAQLSILMTATKTKQAPDWTCKKTKQAQASTGKKNQACGVTIPEISMRDHHPLPAHSVAVRVAHADQMQGHEAQLVILITKTSTRAGNKPKTKEHMIEQQ